MKRLIAIAASLTPLLALIGYAANQPAVFRARIQANILVDSPVYSRAWVNEHLVFPGTPVVLLLGITNPVTPKTGGERALVVVENDWPNLARIRLSLGTVWARTELREVTCQPLHPIWVGPPSAAGPGVFELSEGAYITLKCLLNPAVVDSLAPGDYTIDVDWNGERISRTDLRRHPLESLKDPAGFSIRAVKDAMDALEVELRHMTFAWRQERFAEAIELANRVLLTEPSSVRALATRAEANAGLRRCDEARSDMERAAAAVEANADVNARPSGQDPRRQAQEFRRRFAECR